MTESPELVEHSDAFIQVARVSDSLPGRLRRAELNGRLICLANVEGATLTCPLHLARFDVRTGYVLRGPARDNLHIYTVRIVGEDVLVADPDTPAHDVV